MFHVSTMLPYTSNNTQQVKQAHIYMFQFFSLGDDFSRSVSPLIQNETASVSAKILHYSYLFRLKSFEKASVLHNMHDKEIVFTPTMKIFNAASQTAVLLCAIFDLSL